MFYASKYVLKVTEESTFFVRVGPISVKYSFGYRFFIPVISFFSQFLFGISGNLFLFL